MVTLSSKLKVCLFKGVCVKYMVDDCIFLPHEHVMFGTHGTDRTIVVVSVVVVVSMRGMIYLYSPWACHFWYPWH